MKRIFLILIIFVFFLISSRVYYLTIHKYEYYQNLINNKDNIIEGMTAPRGRILDIKGNILVDNIGVKSIIYNRLNINMDRQLEIATILAENIAITPKISDYQLRYYFLMANSKIIDSRVDDDTNKLYIERKIDSNELLRIKLSLITSEELENTDKTAAHFFNLMNEGYAYQDKIIKTNITNEEYILINSLNLEGIRTDVTWERTYPYGEVLREVFGSVSTYEQGLTFELMNEYLNKGYKLNDRVGTTNLEYIYDEYLKGEKAQYEVKDNHLTMVQNYTRGKDIVLSIDIELQIQTEKILEREIINAKNAQNSKYFKEAYVVVSNPNDGSISALVGRKINEDKTFTDYSWQNVLNAYTVGSVVKGASSALGYKHNLINENTKLIDGCVKLYNQNPKCSWRNLGSITDLTALRMSSNYFQFLIAIGLTGHKYYSGIKINANKEHFNEYRNIFNSFGLGTSTGIDLSNEVTGLKGTTISDDLLLNFSIGQYDTYTPVQLAQYINTVATGERKELSLLKQVLNHDGSIYYEKAPKVLNKIDIEEKYLDRIKEGFRLVNATGTGYGYTNPKITSAGKTGTSETYYSSGIFTISTSYVMYAPFENPQFSIAIVSPDIGYQSNTSNYRYPFNSRVVRELSSMIFDKLNQ